jgi:hypothetical protein
LVCDSDDFGWHACDLTGRISSLQGIKAGAPLFVADLLNQVAHTIAGGYRFDALARRLPSAQFLAALWTGLV